MEDSHALNRCTAANFEWVHSASIVGLCLTITIARAIILVFIQIAERIL